MGRGRGALMGEGFGNMYLHTQILTNEIIPSTKSYVINKQMNRDG